MFILEAQSYCIVDLLDREHFGTGETLLFGSCWYVPSWDVPATQIVVRRTLASHQGRVASAVAPIQPQELPQKVVQPVVGQQHIAPNAQSDSEQQQGTVSRQAVAGRPAVAEQNSRLASLQQAQVRAVSSGSDIGHMEVQQQQPKKEQQQEQVQDAAQAPAEQLQQKAQEGHAQQAARLTQVQRSAASQAPRQQAQQVAVHQPRSQQPQPQPFQSQVAPSALQQQPQQSVQEQASQQPAQQQLAGQGHVPAYGQYIPPMGLQGYPAFSVVSQVLGLCSIA